MGRKFCVRRAVLACFASVALIPRLYSQSTTAGEYEIKAAFMFTFAKFADCMGKCGGLAASGGMIELENERVRFAINPDAMNRAKLKASSKLPALAEIVHDDSGSGRD